MAAERLRVHRETAINLLNVAAVACDGSQSCPPSLANTAAEWALADRSELLARNGLDYRSELNAARNKVLFNSERSL